MKRLALLSLLLAACSFAPISISIPDYSSSVAANFTAITFQKTNQTQTPSTALKSVALTGQITYDGNATLEFYASDEPPCGSQVGGVYSCSLDTTKMEKIGESALQAGVAQSFSWGGSKLTGGVNKNSLYIGAKLKDGLLTGGTLKFRNMVAKVAVF